MKRPTNLPELTTATDSITAKLLIFVSIFFAAGTANLFAQTPVEPYKEISEPPPIRRMSDGEGKQLAAETGVKERTKLALKLMDQRLVLAEKAFESRDYREMYVQLGAFHALMDNTLDFLGERNQGRRKVLYNYKRFEIGLRSLSPRIQLLRRDLPVRYDPYLRTLVKDVRDARDKAIEPLFGDSFAEAEG